MMKFLISYENEFEKSVSSEQANLLQNYIKVFSEDSLVKKKEEYKNGKIIHLIYYINPGETLTNILSDNQYVNSIEIRERQIIGNYTRIDGLEFFEGILQFKGISVLDFNGNEIYSSPVDPITNQHDYEETNKCFYDNNNEKLYVFWYGSNGQFSNMSSYNPKHKEYINEFKQSFRLEDLEDLEDFDWANLNYYHNAETIIPEN